MDALRFLQYLTASACEGVHTTPVISPQANDKPYRLLEPEAAASAAVSDAHGADGERWTGRMIHSEPCTANTTRMAAIRELPVVPFCRTWGRLRFP